MRLLHQATVKHPDGVIDINLFIINDKVKEYTYHLSSEKAARRFHALYRKGKSFHGRALAILNKFKIKEETTS